MHVYYFFHDNFALFYKTSPFLQAFTYYLFKVIIILYKSYLNKVVFPEGF